jgi:hypothetical protein
MVSPIGANYPPHTRDRATTDNARDRLNLGHPARLQNNAQYTELLAIRAKFECAAMPSLKP